jgi:hypothetical protein
MNVGIMTEAAQFLFQEYINSIFGTVWSSAIYGENNVNPRGWWRRRG